MNKYGYDTNEWEAAKEEVRQILIDCAQERRMIPYSEVTPQITSINIGYHDSRFFHLLGEISSSEAQSGRGILTALVVHKSGDYLPGPGFFELAEELGFAVPDNVEFWIQQVEKVFASWADS